MKTKLTNQISRSLIMLMAGAVLFSFSLPADAGRVKRSGKQHEQPWKAKDDSGTMIVPRPVADDSPINPVKKGDREKSKQRHDKHRHQKKSRR